MGRRVFRLWTLGVLVLALAAPARAGLGFWSPFGPPQGFILTLAIDDGRLLAAADSSGVYASTDRGRTWFRSSAGLGNEWIEALAVDVDDHDIYAAGQNRFFRSTDHGAHWTVQGALPEQGQAAYNLLALAPGEPDVVYLAIYDSLFRSPDGGRTWAEVLTSSSVFLSVLVDPNDPESVFVGTGEPGKGLLHSPDGGATWAPVTSVQGPSGLEPFGFGVREITAAETHPTTFFVVSGFQLYRSTDAGASWVPIEVPEPGPGLDQQIISVVATPGPDPRIYAFQQTTDAFRQTVWGSDDLGETWTVRTDQARGTSLRVDPATGDLFSFEIDGVGIAEDEGAAWQFSPLGTLRCGLSFYPWPSPKVRFAQGRTYAVVGGRLWQSRDGAAWSVLARDLDEQCIAIRDVELDSRPGSLWAATGDSVYRSRNGGVTWTRSFGPAPGGDGVPFQGVTLVDARTLLYSGFGIWRSGDHGATWKRTLAGPVLHNEFDEPDFQRSVYRIRVDPENPQIVYAGVIESGERHPPQVLPYLYQSLDGGRTWKRISDQGYVVAIDPRQPRTLYLGTLQGLLRSRDRGRSWEKISDFSIEPGFFVPAGSDLRVDPRNPQILYAARADETEEGMVGVWRSTDGGVTWERLNAGLGELPAFEIFLDPRQAGRLFVASQGLFVGRFPLSGD